MFAFLKQPYPFGGNLRRKFVQNILIGLFVAFFLIVFQPFGTESWHSPYKTGILSGYGLISFAASMTIHGLLFVIFDTERLEQAWTVGCEIILYLIILTAIAGTNMIYGLLLGITAFSVQSFFTWLSIVALLGVFPIVAGILLRHSQYIAMNQKEAAALDARLQHFHQTNPAAPAELILVAENEKEKLLLYTDALLYIESADNYAEVVYLQGGKVQKTLLRGALKRFEDQLASFQNIVRCHRSFIVNLAQVEHISGNAQGYRLIFRHTDVTAPVARNYGTAVLSKIRK